MARPRPCSTIEPLPGPPWPPRPKGRWQATNSTNGLSGRQRGEIRNCFDSAHELTLRLSGCKVKSHVRDESTL